MKFNQMFAKVNFICIGIHSPLCRSSTIVTLTARRPTCKAGVECFPAKPRFWRCVSMTLLLLVVLFNTNILTFRLGRCLDGNLVSGAVSSGTPTQKINKNSPNPHRQTVNPRRTSKTSGRIFIVLSVFLFLCGKVNVGNFT